MIAKPRTPSSDVSLRLDQGTIKRDCVICVRVEANMRATHGGGGERSAVNPLFRDLAEPRPYLIHQGAAGRSEVRMIPGMACEPANYLGRHVGSVVLRHRRTGDARPVAAAGLPCARHYVRGPAGNLRRGRQCGCRHSRSCALSVDYSPAVVSPGALPGSAIIKMCRR